MSKSIGKKILLLLFVTVASLCFIYSANTGQRVFAGSNVYDGTHEYSETELEDRLAYLESEIASLRSELDGIVEVDPNGEILVNLKNNLNSTVAEIKNGSHTWTLNDVAERYLFGDTGINGLLGIYKTASKFYGDYVLADANGYAKVSLEKGLLKFSNAQLISKASEYLQNFDVSNSQIYKGATPYEKCSLTVANKVYGDFDGAVVQPICDENAERQIKIEELKGELTFYFNYYASDKFYDAKVEEIVSVGNENNSIAQFNLEKEYQTAIDKIDNSYQTSETFNAWYESAKKHVKEFKLLFVNAKTALQVKLDSVLSLLKTDGGYTFDKAMLDCESAFVDFSELGDFEYYKKDSEGNYLNYNLKYLTVEGENDQVGDAKVLEQLLRQYIAVTKLQIDKVRIEVAKNYGVSSEREVTERAKLASAIAECLVGYGKLANVALEETPGKSKYIDLNGYEVEISAEVYKYRNEKDEPVTVENGRDIVEAFRQSFEVDKALCYNANGAYKESKNLTKLKKVSDVTGEILDGDDNKIAKITVRAIDESGNPIPYFDVKAKLDVRRGASASVERNLFLLLTGKKEKAKAKLTEEESALLNGKVLLEYLTLTVYEYRNPASEEFTLLEIDETENLQVLITVEFLDGELVEKIKDKTCAFSYRHVTVTDVYKEITWGDTAMTFKVSNFLNQSQLALANEGAAPLDLPKLLIFGAIALVALLFLVWIIAIIIKHKKYKITFDARGGVNKFIRVRVGEKFNHPNAPTRKGYKFIGWYLDKRGTVKFAATQLTRRKNLTVYAKWMSEKDYAKLSDKRAVSAAQAGTNVTVVLDPRGLVSDTRTADTPVTVGDTELAKIEAEKLSYEAKKAEEERKAEEIRLQALREIEEAKKNGEARTRAEEEAAAARAELEKAIADREVLESDARADERNKCFDEIRAISDTVADVPERDVDAEIAKARAEAAAETEDKLRREFAEKAGEQEKFNKEVTDKIKALEETKVKSDDKADESKIKAAYDEGRAAGVAEAKAREEAETARKEAEEARKALEEAETKRKADEEARIRAAYEEGVAARVAAEAKERELAEAEAKRRAEEEERIQRAIELGVAERLAAETAAREEADARARAEQEERLRLAEEARARAEEEARARLEAEVRAREEAEARARAEAEERARLEAESRAKDEVIARERAEAEERARLAAEEARVRAEEEAARIAAEEARARAEAEAVRLAEEARARAEAEETARLAEEARARAEAEEAARLAEEARARAEAEEAARLAAEEEARRLAEEEAAKFDVDHVFDVLKAEIYSYTDADDLGYGLEASVPACAMRVVDKTIELQVNLDKADCVRKGYKVTDGDKLAVKFVIASDDDVDEANELIEETMLVNGLKKTCKAVVTEATAKTREEGFEHGLSKDKIADTPEEFYKLLRVFAKSFVLADDGEVEEKVLIKMFLDRARVYLYVNYTADGLNECDAEMAALGLKSFMTVKTVDECKEAIRVITAMMKENGLIRFPSEVSIAGEDCVKGFTYTLKK